MTNNVIENDLHKKLSFLDQVVSASLSNFVLVKTNLAILQDCFLNNEVDKINLSSVQKQLLLLSIVTNHHKLTDQKEIDLSKKVVDKLNKDNDKDEWLKEILKMVSIDNRKMKIEIDTKESNSKVNDLLNKLEINEKINLCSKINKFTNNNFDNLKTKDNCRFMHYQLSAKYKQELENHTTRININQLNSYNTLNINYHQQQKIIAASKVNIKRKQSISNTNNSDTSTLSTKDMNKLKNYKQISENNNLNKKNKIKILDIEEEKNILMNTQIEKTANKKPNSNQTSDNNRLETKLHSSKDNSNESKEETYLRVINLIKNYKVFPKKHKAAIEQVIKNDLYENSESDKETITLNRKESLVMVIDYKNKEWKVLGNYHNGDK